MEDNGEDTSCLFYDTWENYLESIDEVATVYMITKEKDNDVYATAYCVTGTKTIPEFKFVLHNEEDGSEDVLYDFGTENTIVVSREQLMEDSVVLRVYARVSGEKDEQNIRYDDYRLKN